MVVSYLSMLVGEAWLPISDNIHDLLDTVVDWASYALSGWKPTCVGTSCDE